MIAFVVKYLKRLIFVFKDEAMKKAAEKIQKLSEVEPVTVSKIVETRIFCILVTTGFERN